MKRRTIAVLLALTFMAFNVEVAYARVDSPQTEAFTAAVDESFRAIVPQLFQDSRATYLEGYGVVVTVEVGLEPPRNPFSNSSRTPEEVRRSSLQRLEALKSSTVELLGTHTAGLESLGANEQVSVVIYLMNPNPVDLPDLASQLVISARKQDALDLQSETITTSTFTERVSIREH